MGANYGTGVAPFKECIEDGYGQILWLLKEGDDYIMTEVTAGAVGGVFACL